MPIVHFINNKSQTTGGLRNVLVYVSKAEKTEVEDKKYVTALNCSADTAYEEFNATTNLYHKNSGRLYYHLVQSFPSGYEIAPELAHKIAVEFAGKAFSKYECVVATHIDREHIHSHIVFNSVSFEDGKKYHSDKQSVEQLMELSDLWVQTAVKRILTNELYIGTMVNHKTVTSKIYKTKTFIPPEEQYRHENFCEPIIDETTWKQAQFLLAERAKINPRSQNGRKLHRYSGMIKCADCGSSFTARKRTWRGNEYIEYTCNSYHRYGKEYCTPHTVRESQLDELIKDEVRGFRKTILAESQRYSKIIKDWVKKKPLYEQQIQQHNDKILSLRQQIEDLILERISDREHAQLYNNMITKREEEIKKLEQKISDLREYDKICKERKEQLKNTTQILDEILSEGTISDVNLRMLVKKILIHQNEDKSLDIKFEMNGEFNGTFSVFIQSGDESEIA